ncbi:uncharacterized protein LOC129315681 isoform X1 [Prosopis cineraria]|uniref:uncharacterized protein LOC129315681 isoform X1 n=1 Tax=Prosopis cineraria TaxID=364024 RepID=UPI00240EAFB5|nr:uncharacterized protein LOC129315681 isoform X1 [Prosopis cineraria]
MGCHALRDMSFSMPHKSPGNLTLTQKHSGNRSSIRWLEIAASLASLPEPPLAVLSAAPSVPSMEHMRPLGIRSKNRFQSINFKDYSAEMRCWICWS